MIVDINKIIVKSDRIRKEFGNLQELADDIKQNGLINPPVVNKNYELLAGERRLEACKSLGWSQIEIRMMDTRDAYHELNVEISENESRKEFSKSERVDYMKRLLRIEQAKAKERMSDGGKGVENNATLKRSDEATAKQFDVSASTMRKEISIVDNKGLLTTEDFADWDEGRLSTNKAYQKIKAELAAKNQRISELESLATKIKDAGDAAREESMDLAAEYEEKIRGYEAEISHLKKSQYSPEGQEINAAQRCPANVFAAITQLNKNPGGRTYQKAFKIAAENFDIPKMMEETKKKYKIARCSHWFAISQYPDVVSKLTELYKNA